ncbi:hypothetical protein LguiA_010992 [Lonicera macranthoides]
MTTNPSTHIAVFAFPFGTHAAPLLHLVRRLATSAPSVRFSFFSTSKSNASIFSSGQYSSNVRAYDVADGSPEGHIYSGGKEEPVEFFLKAAPESFKKAVKVAEADAGEKVGGLLTDAFLWFSGEMAAAMGVPWVAFWAGGPSSLSVHVHTEFIRNICMKNDMEKKEETNLKSIPGMMEIRTSDLPEGVISGDLESPFAIMLHNMGLMMPKASAIVINSFEDLHSIVTNDLKTKLQNLISIGPSLLSSLPPSKPDESGCLMWLDTQKDESVLYISFGSICTPPPNELSALADALENSGTPFLWSLRDNDKSHLLEGFLKRTSNIGKIVSWAPQLQVLAHASIGIFVTHCGWNSLLESISYGVPMICRPFFGDHMINSAMVENEWKIGVRVEGGDFTKNGMMKAIQLVLSNAKGKEIRENVNVLKKKAQKAVEFNGSSTKNFKKLLDMYI